MCIHYALQLLSVILHPTSVLILMCHGFMFCNIKNSSCTDTTYVVCLKSKCTDFPMGELVM
jgi:hypothetical protein